MAGVLVGDDGCQFSEIVAIFMKQPMAPIIRSEWADFARCMGTPPQIIDKSRSDLLLDKLSINDVIEKILIEWRSRNGNKCTVVTFLSIIDENLEWKSVTDYLVHKVQQNAVEWNDLDKNSKEAVLTSPVEFQGQKTTLREMTVGFKLNESKLIVILEKFLNKTTIKEILEGPLFKLDNHD